MTNTTPKDTSVEYDAVNHPKHYTSHPSGVECIEITRHMGFNTGNAFKYVWRADLKHDDGGIEDLEKAEFYIKDEIARRKKIKADAEAEKVANSIVATEEITAAKLATISFDVHPASGISTEDAEKLIAKAAKSSINYNFLSR